MYSVSDYGRMLADRVRVDAYRRALAATVRPGDLVVDLGAGSGFFSLEACRLGAGKVIAIETNDAIALLPTMARRAGFSDRIEIVQRPSTEVQLERLANVIVGDLRGVVPLFQENFSTMADARARLLAPTGTMIPQRDAMRAALVSAPSLYAAIVEGWDGHPFEMRDARRAVLNTFHSDRDHPLRSNAHVTTSGTWSELVYGDEPAELVKGRLDLTATQAASAHGIALWFDTTLTAGIGFSSESSERVYARGFLPLEEPVELEVGDNVALELAARRGMGDHVWAWSTTVKRGGTIRASHRQSTFFGLVVSQQTLAKDLDGYRPTTGVRGRAVAAILAGMDGRTSVEVLAERVRREHPGAFASFADALAQTRKIVRDYG